MDKIIILSNTRMYLIYILIYSANEYNNLYILDNEFEIFKYNKIVVFPVKNKFKRLLCNLRDIWRIKKKSIKKTEVFGASHLRISNYFMKRYNFYLIEDGIMNYLDYLYIRNWKDILLGRKRMGLHKNVKKIYLTGLAEIPKAIKDKVEIINLEELWNKKSKEEKKQINEIFGVNIEKLQEVKDRKIILFTQPLSEDNIISEEEKIEIYSKILDKYQQEDVVIKPHLREKTNYSDYFSDCYVMKEKYPVELMIFNGLKVNRAVTLFSTAVFSLNKMAKVDFYGTEVHPKLLERFGSMDHIIKRNCYL